MTAIPTLRKPRQSPAVAYLKHLELKKQLQEQQRMRELELPPPPVTTPRSTNSKKPILTTNMVCGASTSSETESSANTNSSCHDDVSSFLPSSAFGDLHHQESPTSVTQIATPMLEDALVVDALAIYDEYSKEDEDSLVALDRLLAETSRRWSESSRQTHRDFCRNNSCYCKQQDIIIARQAAEIEALKAQLIIHEDELHQVDLPLEQIEVYHDMDDHSVTSGLTHQYGDPRLDDGSIAFRSTRPDAASVTGLHSVIRSNRFDSNVFTWQEYEC